MVTVIILIGGVFFLVVGATFCLAAMFGHKNDRVEMLRTTEAIERAFATQNAEWN